MPSNKFSDRNIEMFHQRLDQLAKIDAPLRGEKKGKFARIEVTLNGEKIHIQSQLLDTLPAEGVGPFFRIKVSPVLVEIFVCGKTIDLF